MAHPSRLKLLRYKGMNPMAANGCFASSERTERLDTSTAVDSSIASQAVAVGDICLVHGDPVLKPNDPQNDPMGWKHVAMVYQTDGTGFSTIDGNADPKISINPGKRFADLHTDGKFKYFFVKVL